MHISNRKQFAKRALKIIAFVLLAVLLLGLLRALKVAFGKDGTDTEDGLKKPARKKVRQGAIHRRGEKL